MSKKELTFEQTISQLEELVGKLEQGDLPLEEALQVFEEGIKLTQAGQKKLTQVQQRVKILLANNQTAELEDFNLKEE